MKSFSSLAEIAATRENSLGAILNRAPEKKPPSAPGAAIDKSTAFSALIIEALKAVNAPLSVRGITSALLERGNPITHKRVSDTAWLLAKQGRLKKVGKGVYALPEE